MNGGNQSSAILSLLLKLKKLATPRLSIRVFLYFFAISLIPVVLVSTLLVNSARDQLIRDTGIKQENIAKDYANRVDSFVEANLQQLSVTARLYSKGLSPFSTIEESLSERLYQVNSLKKLGLILQDGREISLGIKNGVITKDITSQPQASTAAVSLFASRKLPYILSVYNNQVEQKPEIKITVPILKSYAQIPVNGSQFQATSESNIIGVLQGNYDISMLWEKFIKDNVGGSTKRTAYVVDKDGSLASHSKIEILPTLSKSKMTTVEAYEQIRNDRISTKSTINEEDVEVLSSPVRLKYGVGWGVVVQEPISSIYSGVQGYIQSAALVSISAIIFAIITAIFFGRQITQPLRKLSQGARRMESGDFNSSIVINTNDEFEELANSFNNMSNGIKTLIDNLQTNNMKLIIEKAKLNNIISSVSDGIIAVNRSGIIVSANPQASLLLTLLPSDLKGKKVYELFKWEKEGAVIIPDISRAGVFKYDDLVLRNMDTVYYLDLMIAVLEQTAAENNDDVAAIITIRDQTASRELSFMKLDFVAIAAHELRTPLTVVRGYLDMLNTSAVQQMSVYNLENLQKAIVGANQLRELINKLLNIARIERGDMEIFVEKLDLKKLVADNVEQHVSVANQKHQSIIFNSSEEGATYVPADPSSIVEVMNNLLGNALKYTGRGGIIKVDISTDDKFATVKVMDDGPGIPNELRTKLFTKFYRAERSMISGSRGTGLGLFISKTIIELQNGTIGILPDNGHGSTFFFTLPIYNAERDDELITKKTSGGIHGWFKKRTNH